MIGGKLPPGKASFVAYTSCIHNASGCLHCDAIDDLKSECLCDSAIDACVTRTRIDKARSDVWIRHRSILLSEQRDIGVWHCDLNNLSRPKDDHLSVRVIFAPRPSGRV